MIPPTSAWFDGPNAAPKYRVRQDVATHEKWLASDPGRDALEEWFGAAWRSYHDGTPGRSPRFIAYGDFLKTCVLLMVAIRVKVEARDPDLQHALSAGGLTACGQGADPVTTTTWPAIVTCPECKVATA